MIEQRRGVYLATVTPLTSLDFVALVRTSVPGADAIIDEHLSDNDELLIHLLLPDLLRFAVARFSVGDVDTSGRVLDVVATALTDGGDALVNAVAVSFLESAGTGEGETPAFLASWPPALRAALLERQQLEEFAGGQLSALNSAVARLALPAREQIGYLEQLGTAPLVDELALEFDDIYLAAAAQWGASSIRSELLGLLAQIDAALAAQNAWTVDDLESRSWAEIRQLAKSALARIQSLSDR